MSEGLGMTGMTETPVVIMLGQRPGPSTGLPTRSEQSDLTFALQPGHGDMVHFVVAPGSIDDVIQDSYEAFNWADRYQVPVIVMLDKKIQSGYQTVDDFGLDKLPPIDRGKIWDGKGDNYLRYQFTDDGISPRSIPGMEGGIFWTTTDEHDQRGHITESAENRVTIMNKRMGKFALALKEIPSSRKIAKFGPADAETTIVCWGTATGSARDAMDVLAKEGIKVNVLQIRLMKPFPVDEVVAELKKAKLTILAEENYNGQLGDLIRTATGITVDKRVVKFDGRPFSEEELVEGIKTAISSSDVRIPVTHYLP